MTENTRKPSVADVRSKIEAAMDIVSARMRALNAAANALTERAAGHYKAGDHKLQDECLRCAAIVRDTRPTLQLAAPSADVELLKRLLEDHERMEPHHAALCKLCLDTKAAIASLEGL